MSEQTSVDDLAASWHFLESQRTEIVEQQNAIKAELRARLPIGTHAAGSAQVTISPPQAKFDARLAERVLPADLLPSITRTVVDRALAERILPPALYSACQVAPAGAERVVRIR